MDHPIIIIAQTQIVLIDSNHVRNNLQTLFEALRKVRASLPSTPQLTPSILPCPPPRGQGRAVGSNGTYTTIYILYIRILQKCCTSGCKVLQVSPQPEAD